jgi:hypothetical protein
MIVESEFFFSILKKTKTTIGVVVVVLALINYNKINIYFMCDLFTCEKKFSF